MAKKEREPVKVERPKIQGPKRKYNRTVNQDVQRSEPKWEDAGGGVLVNKQTGNAICRGKTNKWESVRKTPAQRAAA